MASGGVTVTPGRVLTSTELVNNSKLNDLGRPVLRVDANAITSRELADGSISADKLDVDLEAQLGLADGSVTTAKIVDGAVTFLKLAADVTSLFTLGRGYIDGLTLANNGADLINDIDVAAGACRDSTDAGDMRLVTGVTKFLNVNWAVGTSQGGLDTGAIADNQYHVFLIKRADTGVVDALFSTTLSPTMPTNYTHKRRIGSIIRLSGAIMAFIQNGDLFEIKSPALDVDVANLGTSSTNYAMATIPPDLKLRVLLNVVISHASIATVYVRDPDTTDVAPSSIAAPLANMRNVNTGSPSCSQLWVVTNASRQIAARSNSNNTDFRVSPVAWIDTRGRNS